MKHLSVMIKPASSLCNLRCKYCFYEDEAAIRCKDSYGIMGRDIMEAVIDYVFKGLEGRDEITFAFQGGEPTIAGIDFFKDFTGYVNHKKSELETISISYAIQTNATLLDEEWCNLFAKENFLVGVSLDLHRASHDSARVDIEGKGTFDKVIQGIKLLKNHGVSYNILCTLTNELAQYPRKVWDTIVKNDFEFVQFTPCMDGLEKGNGYGLTPEKFLDFYKDIFDRWYVDLRAGKIRSIKLFDDIANIMLWGIRTACGIDGHCMPQIIVESNGSVYPCDFYCIDEYEIGNLAKEDILSLYDKSENFSNASYKPPVKCKDCRYSRICGGNCRRMRRNICFVDEEGDSCRYRELLDYIGPKLNLLKTH